MPRTFPLPFPDGSEETAWHSPTLVSSPAARKGQSPCDLGGEFPVVDLTRRNTELGQREPPKRRYWRTKAVRRTTARRVSDHEPDREVSDGDPRVALSGDKGTLFGVSQKDQVEVTHFHYISGPQHFFHKFVRQHTVWAVAVWLLLFTGELAMCTLYVVESTVTAEVSWTAFSASEFSGWFYARSILTLALLLQLVFAYSIDGVTLVAVVATSLYQIILFFMAFGPGLGWLSRMYVPTFLRVWPLRQYFLFAMDTAALLFRRQRKFDALRLAASPISHYLCIIACATCVFHLDHNFRGYPMNLGVALYFMMMTVTTVGFGDVTPKTPEGQAMTIVFIFIFVARLWAVLAILRSTVKILRSLRTYRGRKNHFVVYGFVTREDAVAIMDEVFRLYPMKSVCFANKEFPPEVCHVERSPQYRLRCTFLTVDYLDNFAAKRLKLHKACAIIVLPTREEVTSRGDDEVMLASVFFDRVAPNVPQYMWLKYGLHRKVLTGHKETMVEQSAKKSVLASALLLPGIIPFLVNLIRTSSVRPPANRHEAPTLWTEEGCHNWKDLYEYSRRNVILTCPPPESCVGKSLRNATARMKLYNILIVGIEDAARNVIKLDLSYVIEKNDVLIIIYEGNNTTLANALNWLDSQREDTEGFNQGSFFSEPNAYDMSNADLFNRNINASIALYPYHSFDGSFCQPCNMSPASGSHERHGLRTLDLAESRDRALSHTRVGRCVDEEDGHGDRDGEASVTFQRAASLSNYGTLPTRGSAENLTVSYGDDGEPSEERVKGELQHLPFVQQRPRGLRFELLNLAESVGSLHRLLDHYNRCMTNKHLQHYERERLLQDLQEKINDVVFKAADATVLGAMRAYRRDMGDLSRIAEPSSRTALSLEEPTAPPLGAHENFLFVDLAATISKSRSHSVYGEQLSSIIAQHELYLMMQCITSIHLNSKLILLTLRKFPAEFLEVWKRAFGSPLKYIRGQGYLYPHLDFAITREGGLSSVRGVLLFCSQFGCRDYGDVPLFSVEATLRKFLDLEARERARMTQLHPGVVMPERNIVVELHTFKSCLLMTPTHSDPEWLLRGQQNFQDSLAFMMGRCFSANMLQTIMIHVHRDYRVLRFFEMVLSLSQTTDELFDTNLWSQNATNTRTLFQICGNQSLQFATFGNAFEFLLKQRSCVAIGVFRVFPGLGDPCISTSRYFITNPSLRMHLLRDDIIYGLDGSGGRNVASEPYKTQQPL